MPDLSLAVQITRDFLGLPVLSLNDHLNYYVGANFLGGAATFDRTKAASAFLDGDVTIYRTRATVREDIEIEVRGADAAEATANLTAVIDAFTQDEFGIAVLIANRAGPIASPFVLDNPFPLAGGVLTTYVCEAADYTVTWTGPRAVCNALQVRFTVPRRPTPVLRTNPTAHA